MIISYKYFPGPGFARSALLSFGTTAFLYYSWEIPKDFLISESVDGILYPYGQGDLSKPLTFITSVDLGPRPSIVPFPRDK